MRKMITVTKNGTSFIFGGKKVGCESLLMIILRGSSKEELYADAGRWHKLRHHNSFREEEEKKLTSLLDAFLYI